jgi:hypothetical protein
MEKIGGHKSYDTWIATYKRGREFLRWDNRAALREIRRRVSERIVFVGDTAGGDVGAHLFLHKNGGQIDSIIIDNNCLFSASAES